MISIKKYSKNFINQWNDFVSSANNGTLFSNRDFLNYHIDRAFQDCSLLFFKNKKIVAVLPAAIKNNSLHSHPGASYGGIIILKETSFKTINYIVAELESFCIKKKFSSIVLKIPPASYLSSYDESTNYILERNGFKIKERYISHLANISSKKDVKSLLTKRKQRYVNNSFVYSQIILKESDSFSSFYKILFNLKKKYSSKPTHSLNELKNIKKLFPQKCILILSKLKNKIVGGTLMFFINKKVSLVFYNVVLDSFRKSQLSAYQLYNCMVFSKKQGYRLVDFGVSQNPESSDPLSPKISLIQFKECFGAKGAMRTVYIKKFKYDKT